jgi:N utilization substance protein B
VALQVLYAVDLVRSHRQEGDAGECVVEPCDWVRIFDGVADNFEAPARAKGFASELVEQVAARGEELDATIALQASNWRISRMAAVDRNILRLGTYELRYTETPSAVVLNEAIELARRFGSDSSPAFVNGILDAIAREVRGGAPREGRT